MYLLWVTGLLLAISCGVTVLVAALGQAGSNEIKHAIFACGALSEVSTLPLIDMKEKDLTSSRYNLSWDLYTFYSNEYFFLLKT